MNPQNFEFLMFIRLKEIFFLLASPWKDQKKKNRLKIKVIANQFCFIGSCIYKVHGAHLQGEAKILALELNSCWDFICRKGILSSTILNYEKFLKVQTSCRFVYHVPSRQPFFTKQSKSHRIIWFVNFYLGVFVQHWRALKWMSFSTTLNYDYWPKQ